MGLGLGLGLGLVDDLRRSLRLAGSASMKAFMSFCGSPASVGEKGICRSVSSASTSALLVAAAASSLMPPPAGSRSLTVASSRSSRSSVSPSSVRSAPAPGRGEG